MKITKRFMVFLVALSFILVFGSVGARAETLTADVVVVGAGGGGLCAALAAKEAGAKVILFEKAPFPGGTSNFAEGIFAAESEMQRKAQVDVSRDDAFRTIMEYTHWRANPRLARAFVNKSASTIEWLQALGVEFIEPYAMWPGSPRTWHLIKGEGAAMVKVLAAKVKERGIEFRTSTPAVKIIREGGKITGVIAKTKDGKEIRVNTKAVIVATGGYAKNKEMLKKYAGLDLGRNLFQAIPLNLMGDGIRMAWEVGAAQEGLGVLQGFGPGAPVGPGLKPGVGQLMAAGWQPYLWVNPKGMRFCDELVGFNFPYAGNAVVKYDYVYNVFDETAKKYMVEKGIDNGVGVLLPVTTKLTNLDAEMKEAMAKGNPNVFIANSVEELAKKMGVRPEVLKATVDEYNGFCAQGHDDLFAKDRRYLRQLKTPPFYGLRLYNLILGTLGGIKINERIEVLDTKDEVIPGLYAVGIDAGGMYGDTYDLYTSGGTLGFAVNSGRIAGENAAAYSRK